MKLALVALVLAAGALVAPRGAVADPMSAAGWKGYAAARVATNPTAGALVLGARYRHVYRLSDNPIFHGAMVQAGGDLATAISTSRAALHVEWLPLAITRLRLQGELWWWTGMATDVGHGLTFPSARSPFGPAELERREGEEEAALGTRLAFQPSLEGKAGPVVVFVAGEAALWYIGGDRSFWLEPLHDTLIERGSPDGTIKMTSGLLVEVWSQDGGDANLRAGPTHEVFHALAADITRHRAGGLVSFTPRRRLGWLEKPTVFTALGWNLVDRNRDGEAWLTLGCATMF